MNVLTIEKCKPSLKNLFPSSLYNLTLHNKIRWVIQLPVGYDIYKFFYEEKEIGYCAVSYGKNPRYPFINKSNESIIGPYYILEEYRGSGLATKYITKLIPEVIEKVDAIYAFIQADNIASIKTVEECVFFLLF